jgi:hypothetical protein
LLQVLGHELARARAEVDRGGEGEFRDHFERLMHFTTEYTESRGVNH